MRKTSSSKTKSLTISRSKVEHFSKFAPRGVSLPKSFGAAVGFDKAKRPSWFLFDSYAFWELLCRIDEKLFETMPDKAYDSNPVGSIVDEIEERWPFSNEYREEIKREYKSALKDISSGKIYPL